MGVIVHRRRLAGGLHLARALRAGRRGAAAVEFALVCAPFVVFLLAVMVVAFNFYMQQALDYALESAARQIEIGNVPANYTAADFLNKVFCPTFGQFQQCANIFIDAHPVTDFESVAQPGVADGPASTNTNGFVFCPGRPGQLMYLHMVYLGPAFGGSLLNGGGTTGFTTFVANAAFANQNPTGTPVVNAAGC